MKKIILLSLILIAGLALVGCTGQQVQPEFDAQGNQIQQDAGAGQVSQQSPLSEHGVLQFEVNKSQMFHLEAKGASSALVKNVETEDEYILTYDKDLKLWKGDIVFRQPGIFHLEGHISNDFGETYTRQINTVIVVQNPSLRTATGEPAQNVIATINVKDPATGEFNVWNGLAFGVNNPLSIPTGFSAVLPKGEYYLDVTADGYDPMTSLITKVPAQSIVTADIVLVKPKGFIGKIISIFSSGEGKNNFPLKATPLPQENLLTIGDVVPDIIAYDVDGEKLNLFDTLTNNPTIVFVHSNWNTEAQEQMAIYSNVTEGLGDKYNYLPITTLEPDNINITQLDRGDYQIDFYKPTNSFYDNYLIISLPQFFILNENEELLGVITGSHSALEIIDMIEDIMSF